MDRSFAHTLLLLHAVTIFAAVDCAFFFQNGFGQQNLLGGPNSGGLITPQTWTQARPIRVQRAASTQRGRRLLTDLTFYNITSTENFQGDLYNNNGEVIGIVRHGGLICFNVAYCETLAVPVARVPAVEVEADFDAYQRAGKVIEGFVDTDPKQRVAGGTIDTEAAQALFDDITHSPGAAAAVNADPKNQATAQKTPKGTFTPAAIPNAAAPSVTSQEIEALAPTVHAAAPAPIPEVVPAPATSI